MRAMHALIVASFSFVALTAATCKDPVVPAVVCTKTQDLTHEWQRELAAERRDAAKKKLYPRMREGITHWGTLRRRARAPEGCN